MIAESSFQRLMRQASSPDAPIRPKQSDELSPPLRPVMRWIVASGGSLFKRFKFKNIQERNRFVFELLEYEASVQHNATIKVTENEVLVAVITNDLNVVTELDREYADQADMIYKDIVETAIDVFEP